MGAFKASPGLMSTVSRMVTPGVRSIAEEVRREAVKLAPPGKRWVSMSDPAVRDTHRVAHAHGMIPANLRFKVPKKSWDSQHGLGESGSHDYLLRPKDTSTGLPLDSVQHVHCRCTTAFDPGAIAKNIRIESVVATSRAVTATVVAAAPHVVAAERGDVYPTGTRAVGTFFMSRAAKRVAGTGGRSPAPTIADWLNGGPGAVGNGSQNNHG